MSEKKDRLDQAAQKANKADNCNTENPEEAAGDNPEVCFPYEDVNAIMAAIEEKNQLLEEQCDRYKRLQADFENFRRRTRQEKEELSSIVSQGIILEILPVLDNFERALNSAATQDAAALLAGVEMIYKQFICLLEKVGLTPIIAEGTQFDPQQHEAVMRIEDADRPDGMIVQELQKGYKVQGKVIRPSMVKVVSNC